MTTKSSKNGAMTSSRMSWQIYKRKRKREKSEQLTKVEASNWRRRLVDKEHVFKDVFLLLNFRDNCGRHIRCFRDYNEI